MAADQITKDLNILLLGETGVGKSTWINGFINYLQHKTLEEAEAGGMTCLIPMSFTIMDDKFEVHSVSTGTDVNERSSDCQSSTQFPRTYVFPAYNGYVRLIDTPGIGDTRGVEQDKKNFQNILNHIATIDDLHGICILLKPNNARLDITFEYCVRGLFANLHRDACRNVVFCFTNCRGTSYRPGDTKRTLEKLLTENDVDIATDKKGLYCVDNEGLRYLAVRKQGVKLGDVERQASLDSWSRAVVECERMLQHFCTVTPHRVKNTLSVNHARYMILYLIKPLEEVCANLERNRQDVTEIKDELANKQSVIQRLLSFHKTSPVALSKARLVCTSSKCTQSFNDGIYAQRTRYPCCLESNQILELRYRHERSGPCEGCGCAQSDHEIITCDFEVIESDEIRKLIRPDKPETEINIKEERLMKLHALASELDDEYAQIMQANRKFATFLKKNAIAPYNKAVTQYVEHAIAASDATQAKHLRAVCQQYAEESNALDRAITGISLIGGGDDDVTPDEIRRLIDELYSMKHTGLNIKESAQTAEEAYTNVLRSSDVVYLVKLRLDRSNSRQSQGAYCVVDGDAERQTMSRRPTESLYNPNDERTTRKHKRHAIYKL